MSFRGVVLYPVLHVLGFTSMIGVAVKGSLYPVLHVLGFTSAGIAKYSFAAFLHSMIGVAVKGSLFSVLQSIGATAVFSVSALIAYPVVIAAGAFGFLRLFRR
eukprot:CAMPEP_0117443536 /NCGR_PEP_ID=MMETSP0759-20121206/4744_1 /TAXON_ID=63605 /ORGANISM="Percolomonas cosmopolitus, Strain WS" /LENGTH=102 /DNA_ID=CAMNT_0005235511 /DNA_START=69 /DNA_END=377 /DNA_ORIENTATION=+